MAKDKDEKRKEAELKYLKKKLISHKGKWLTEDAVEEIQKRAEKLPDTYGQMIGERRKLCFEIMEEYDIDEIEATNIINGRWAANYVTKYYRIRNQIPLDIKKKKNETEEESVPGHTEFHKEIQQCRSGRVLQAGDFP